MAAAVTISEAESTQLLMWLPVGLAGACAYWQLMPVLSASMGSSLDLRKLRVYPVPHRKLFAIEALLRLTTALEALLMLAGGAVGLAANRTAGGAAAAARMAAAIPLFVLFNLLLASGTKSLVERLLTRRKVREILVLVMAMLWVAPRLLYYLGYGRGSLDRLEAAMQTIALPWTEAAWAALGQMSIAAFASLGLWTAAAWWFGRWQFERGLRHDPTAAQAAGPRETGLRASTAERLYRLPGRIWRDPLAAVIEKELRSLARTPRFRTVFIMGFTFGLAVWFPVVAGRRSGGPDTSWFLTVVCVYALTLLGQVSYWNCFGFDRSATAFYFAAPVEIGRVFAAKNIAALIYIYLEVVMVIGVTAALRLSAGWRTVVETLVVMGICASYLLALGNWGSVRYPRGLSGDRAAQGGGRGFQGFLFLIYPTALLPVGLAYLARYAFDSEAIFAMALAIAAIIGGVFYRIALETAVKTAVERREQMVQELSQGEGPVAGQ